MGPMTIGMGAYFDYVPVRGNAISSGRNAGRALYYETRAGGDGACELSARAGLAGPTAGGKGCGAGPRRGGGRANVGGKITASYARMEVVQPDEVGMTRVEPVSGQPYIDHLTQYVRVSLGVVDGGHAANVCGGVSLDWGSGVASTLEAGNGGEDNSAWTPIKDATPQRAAGGTLEAGDGAQDQAAGAPMTDAIEIGQEGDTGSVCVSDLSAAGAVGGIEGVCVLELSGAASDVRCMPAAIGGEQPAGAQALQGQVARGPDMDSAREPDGNQVLSARAGDDARLPVKVAAARAQD